MVNVYVTVMSDEVISVISRKLISILQTSKSVAVASSSAQRVVSNGFHFQVGFIYKQWLVLKGIFVVYLACGQLGQVWSRSGVLNSDTKHVP